mgnify:CR=1 FL=1
MFIPGAEHNDIYYILLFVVSLNPFKPMDPYCLSLLTMVKSSGPYNPQRVSMSGADRTVCNMYLVK